jgi:hypothetical protein
MRYAALWGNFSAREYLKSINKAKILRKIRFSQTLGFCLKIKKQGQVIGFY